MDIVQNEWDTGLAGAVGLGQEEVSLLSKRGENGGEMGNMIQCRVERLVAERISSQWSLIFLCLLSEKREQDGR